MARRQTREQWLNGLAGLLRPAFRAHGAPIPRKVRMACSWTGHGARSHAIGQCWTTSVSKDETWEIMISPIMDTALKAGGQGVADILAHELVHAAVGLLPGHGGEFKRVALALGLTGKMTATTAGPEFVKLVRPMLKKLGKYPHAEIMPGGNGKPIPPVMVPDPANPDGPKIPLPRTSGPKKQGTRLLKAACSECGYTVRVTRTWLAKGSPLCPCNCKPMAHDPVA